MCVFSGPRGSPTSRVSERGSLVGIGSEERPARSASFMLFMYYIYVI